MTFSNHHCFVMPAKAGIQSGLGTSSPLIPAFAGMTENGQKQLR
jgi:hypothetical protein